MDRADDMTSTTEEVKVRGLIVFVVILLLGGGFFWALVGGCVAS
jgi:hypothetical protein